MKASIVLFDFGNVLASWQPDRRIAEYARLTGLAPQEVRARLERDAFSSDADTGHYTLDEIEAEICERLEHEFSHAELLRLQAIAFELQPTMISLARAVHRRCAVGVLTNNGPLFRACLGSSFPEVAQICDPILVSSELGYVKPDPRSFAAAEAALGLTGERIVFVDDTEAHVVAARSRGWHASVYRSVTELERDFAAVGLIAPDTRSRGGPQ